VTTGILAGMITGSAIFVYSHSTPEVIAYEAPIEVIEVKPIPVVKQWTPKEIKQEINRVFGNNPVAVAVAQAEGGLKKEVQSSYYAQGKRETSYCTFQIHAPSWDKEAKRLGYDEYKTNPEHCIAMAYHIYQSQGWHPWSVYKNNDYKKYMP